MHFFSPQFKQTNQKKDVIDLFLLSSNSRAMGSLQQALVCFEKRLVVAHELGGEGGEKAQAYCELGTLHSQLGNYEQALSCLEHQLNIARTAGVRRRSQKVSPLSSPRFSSCHMTNDLCCFHKKKRIARGNP